MEAGWREDAWQACATGDDTPSSQVACRIHALCCSNCGDVRHDALHLGIAAADHLTLVTTKGYFNVGA
eukprot:487530-Amphidinium_carterae.1